VDVRPMDAAMIIGCGCCWCDHLRGDRWLSWLKQVNFADDDDKIMTKAFWFAS
jgi:hypothetical protein